VVPAVIGYPPSAIFDKSSEQGANKKEGDYNQDRHGCSALIILPRALKVYRARDPYPGGTKMFDWLAAHWLLLLIVTVVWFALSFTGMFLSVESDNGWLAIASWISTAFAWIPAIGFLIGIIIAIINHFVA